MLDFIKLHHKIIFNNSQNIRKKVECIRLG